jgi:hypothetical protein
VGAIGVTSDVFDVAVMEEVVAGEGKLSQVLSTE